jgi:hypothetical protein
MDVKEFRESPVMPRVTNRRKAIQVIAKGLAALGLAACTDPTSLSVAPSRQSPKDNALTRGSFRTTAMHPMPSHLPPGYSFRHVHSGDLAGFRGGELEDIFDFKNPKIEHWYRTPLLVAITSSPTKELHGAEHHVGTSIDVVRDGGDTVQVVYHDGSWRRSLSAPHTKYWDQTDEHSAVIVLSSLTVGVRGWRSAGITREELVATAVGALT